MKTLLQILILTFLAMSNLFGQSELPKNLKQAVKYLDKDCPDDVKTKIKTAGEDSLSYAVYPFADDEPYKSYETIFNWTDNQNGNPKLKRYLDKKGIYNYQFEILLDAFQQKLQNGKINQKELIKKFLDKERKLAEKQKIKYDTDTINGIYIPKDLADCFAQINSFWDDSTKMQVRNWEEREFTGKVHLGFGMWIRNNWQLWGGSRLSKYFNDLGIYHPDDMSGIILVSYHRHLNNLESNLEAQIQYHHDYWQKRETARSERKQEEFSKYKLGDTLEFNYNKGYVSKEQEDKYDDDACIAKGIVTERNEKDFIIKVKIIEACDRKGIIYYDNDGERIYNSKTKRWSDPPKRIIKKVKKNKVQWFKYADWSAI